jgi:hypothetical protein
VTRAEYKAASRKLRTFRRPTFAFESSWQRVQQLEVEIRYWSAIVNPACPGQQRDRDLIAMRERWKHRRHAVARARAQRLHDRRVADALARTDFARMTPLQACLRRIAIEFGGQYAEPQA